MPRQKIILYNPKSVFFTMPLGLMAVASALDRSRYDVQIIDGRRVVEMAEEFLRRGLWFTWTATMRADQGSRLSDQALQNCVRAGLRWLMVGVESGSQEMLEYLKKDVKIEQILAIAERCAKHGIQCVFPHIVGFPGETDASIPLEKAIIERLKPLPKIS
ncbi:MAG: radical SAM protein [Chlorobi bacterium]|nr:MAG: Radical SAM superfamily protein [Chlorobi bacterium OLB7]MBK8911959.1 radical SAM protein [Chlorobiota bacterium]MBX7215402.1 radical SAM protein [Candidatus Kapabacteria bacterium]